MHQERDADGLAHLRGKIHRLVNPGLAVATLMENRLKDVAVAIAAHRSKDSTNQTFRVSSSRTAIARL